VVAHATLEAQRKGERGGEIFGAARAWVKTASISRGYGEAGLVLALSPCGPVVGLSVPRAVPRPCAGID
jgi:hypothetical protein